MGANEQNVLYTVPKVTYPFGNLELEEVTLYLPILILEILFVHDTRIYDEFYIHYVGPFHSLNDTLSVHL